MKNMNEECLICKEALEYLENDEQMQCYICGKIEKSKMRCINKHYICNDCHMKGIDSIINICLENNSKNPIEILNTLMSQPFCHMHGPEHHILVGSSILTAFKNAGGKINLKGALMELINRAKQVPGGSCGYWGACGAAISSGMAISIIVKSTPLTIKEFQLSNKMTSLSLDKISKHGGPRCCKRDSYLSIETAIDFIKENLDVALEKTDITCNHFHQNNQCKKTECLYYPKKIY